MDHTNPTPEVPLSHQVTPIRHAPGVIEPCDRCPSPSAFWVSPKSPAANGMGFVLGEPSKLCVGCADAEVSQ